MTTPKEAPSFFSRYLQYVPMTEQAPPLLFLPPFSLFHSLNQNNGYICTRSALVRMRKIRPQDNNDPPSMRWCACSCSCWLNGFRRNVLFVGLTASMSVSLLPHTQWSISLEQRVCIFFFLAALPPPFTIFLHDRARASLQILSDYLSPRRGDGGEPFLGFRGSYCNTHKLTYRDIIFFTKAPWVPLNNVSDWHIYRQSFINGIWKG